MFVSKNSLDLIWTTKSRKNDINKILFSIEWPSQSNAKITISVITAINDIIGNFVMFGVYKVNIF